MFFYVKAQNPVLESNFADKILVKLSLKRTYLRLPSLHSFSKLIKIKFMTKTELAANLAAETDLTKARASEAVNVVFESIKEQLSNGDKVVITGFGTFEVRVRKDRNGVVPGTNKKIKIKGGPYPAFRSGKQLKEAISTSKKLKKKKK